MENATTPTAKKVKTHVILIKTISYRGNQPDRYSYKQGTIEELTEYFAYTLECGWSWNKKINMKPITITGLISNVNKSYNETQGSSYRRTSIEIATVQQMEIAATHNPALAANQ